MATVGLREVCPSFVKRLPLTGAALEFALERHAGQVRDGDHAPFVLHPLEVGSLLSLAGYADRVVAAGVLHDVLEDTATDDAELAERFGPGVSALVRAVSEDPSIEDERLRKAALRSKVARSPVEAAAVFAADKVSKARELRLKLSCGLAGHEVEPATTERASRCSSVRSAPTIRSSSSCDSSSRRSTRCPPPRGPRAGAAGRLRD